MVRCPKCGSENGEDQNFCGRCGTELDKREVRGSVEMPCYKHKKVLTLVTCGRCERPICTKCIVIGPAGTRCRECARHKVPVRARGLLHDAGKGVKQVNVRHVWYVAIFVMIANFFRGMFGGGGDA